MPGLLFRDSQPATTTAPHRADVVCFIGFVGRRSASPLPGRLKTWLQDQGWRPRGVAVADDDPLLDVPVPLDSFEAFDRLFTWETRPPQPHAFPFTTWLGAAVRSFFRQGGARCFVVRTGDPAPYSLLGDSATTAEHTAFAAAQRARLGALLPGLPGSGVPAAEKAAPETWRGLGVLFGLEEAAFACLPDLPELVADSALEPAGLAPLPPAPERFVTCTPTVAPPRDEVRQVSAGPACTDAGYLAWRNAAHHAALFVRTHRRDVQLLLSLPLPAPAIATAYTRNLDVETQVLGLGRGKTLDATDGIATAFLQLCFPWVLTPGAEALPGGLEPPDGVFAGVLARTIPELGAGHSIGRQPLRGVHGFEPGLAVEDLVLDTPAGASPALIHRVSLLGPSPDGPRVLSDVTTSLSTAHRPASVGRLTAAILRAARRLGDTVAFEPAGEDLARRIRTQLEQLLADFHAAGALQGITPGEAYSVRCDTTTTTQNDLDNGRVIAEVRFTPSHPVGLIVVILSLRAGSVTALDVLT
jgi:hypothetical protein